MTSSTEPSKPLSTRLWIGLIFLGFVGELAWAVENQYYNTYMYDNITRDPAPIAAMVGLSAVVATLTTIFMGTLSDRTRTRWGRRRPYIIIGYLIWGLLTAIFPLASRFQPVALAVGMAILFDCIMNYFGATAHNAGLSAYVTDVTTLENRGRVVSVLELMRWVALLIVYGGAGIIIQAFNYEIFFYGIGALVLLFGLVGGIFIQEQPAVEKQVGTYWKDILDSFRWRNLLQNRDFFLVLIGVSIFAIAQQVYFPYLLIYLQNYLELGVMESSIAVAVAIVVGGIGLAYPFGILVDRLGRRTVALLAIIPEIIGLGLFALSRSTWTVVLTGILWLAPYAAWTIATGAWCKDLFPEDKRGQYAGYFLVFWVAIPMVFGPMLGSWVVSTFGIPTTLNGEAGFIPTEAIFWVSAALTPLAAVPLLFTAKKKKTTE